MNTRAGLSVAELGLILAATVLVAVCLFIDPLWLGILIAFILCGPLLVMAVRLAARRPAARAAVGDEASGRRRLLSIALGWSPLLLVGLLATAVWAGSMPGDALDRIGEIRGGPARGKVLLLGLARMRATLGDRGIGLVGLSLIGVYIVAVGWRMRRSRPPA